MRPVVLSRWFLNTTPRPHATIRLFCFPYGGGGASIYHTWAKGLPPEIEVIAVQPPGREHRINETPFRSVKPLIDELAAEIVPLLDKPFAFFGHSMGALLAYELTCALRRLGHPLPKRLYASSHAAPQLPRVSQTHLLPDEAFWERVRLLNGTPQEVLENEELRELVLPTIKADFELCETYQFEPVPPLPLPITVYAGLQESKHQADFRAWQEQTTKEFQMRMFPGDHFYLNTARDLLIGILSYDLYKMR